MFRHCFECTSNTVWPGQPLQDGNNGFKTYTILSENASIVLNNNGTEKTEDIKITVKENNLILETRKLLVYQWSLIGSRTDHLKIKY